MMIWLRLALIWLILCGGYALVPRPGAQAQSSRSMLMACPAGGNDGATNLLVHMNGANAGTTFTDYSIGAQTLTPTNATTSTTRSKFFDSSASFGGNAFIKTNGTSWTFAGDFTIEAWIFLTSTSVLQAIASTNTNATNDWEFFISAANHLTFTATSVIAQAGTVSGSAWHHVAAVRSSGTLKLYIDGVNDGSGTPTLTSNSSVLQLGANPTDGSQTQFFNGNMQEVRVSNIARWTANFVPPTFPYC